MEKKYQPMIKIRYNFILIITLILSGIASLANQGRFGGNKNFVAGEVIVVYKSNAYPVSQRSLSRASKEKIIAKTSGPRIVRLKLSKEQDVINTVERYRDDPGVLFAQPNYIYRAAATIPDDNYYDELWAVDNTGQTLSSPSYIRNNPGLEGKDLDLEKVWDQITDCSSVTIAVLDSGINISHEDLVSNLWDGSSSCKDSSGNDIIAGCPNHGWDFVDNDNDPTDVHGHGTHVAGIIGAVGNNGMGTTGVCWNASVMGIRVLDSTATGSTVELIEGINFAVANGAKIINMSLTGLVYDPALDLAISNAREKGVVVIVAAGNEGKNNNGGEVAYPCNFDHDNIVCVAAIDQSYVLANFSNWGSTSVDLGAPGTNIMGLWAGTGATIEDDFSSGWTSNGGWTYDGSNCDMDSLVNPADWCTSSSPNYLDNSDERAYKSFDLSTVDYAYMDFGISLDIRTGDFFNINMKDTGGDPFSGGVGLLGLYLDAHTYGEFVPLSFDLTGCATTNCSIGFQLISDSNNNPDEYGFAIIGFRIHTLSINNASYKMMSGTSFASPYVAGIAAMIMSYNPDYRYSDVIRAMKEGGEQTDSLSEKTVTGKAINAWESLIYIQPPSELTLVVAESDTH
jgi:subtilisin family serine protease